MCNFQLNVEFVLKIILKNLCYLLQQYFIQMKRYKLNHTLFIPIRAHMRMHICKVDM